MNFKTVLSALLLMTSLNARAASMLILSGHYGYGIQNIFTEEQVPTYRAATWGFDVEYMVGRRNIFEDSLLFGPFFSYNYMNGENSANNEELQETLGAKNSVFGLKLYTKPLYLKFGVGKKSFKDIITAQTESILEFSGTSYNFQTGLTFDISNSWKIDFGLDAGYTKIDPLENNLSQRLDHWQFSALISIGYILNSGRELNPSY